MNPISTGPLGKSLGGKAWSHVNPALLTHSTLRLISHSPDPVCGVGAGVTGISGVGAGVGAGVVGPPVGGGVETAEGRGVGTALGAGDVTVGGNSVGGDPVGNASVG